MSLLINKQDKIMVKVLGLNGEQIRALLGGFVSMLIYGSSYTYGTLIPYVTAYIYHSGNTTLS